jgi:glycosyltransferase involved in cell wall biosynthesis
VSRPRVAYYSPLPPSRSGIADYSALLLPELARRVDIVVARPGRFKRVPNADVCLYHVGNDPDAHAWIVDELRRRPGIVVLHELVLHHLVAGLTLARGDADAYLDAMEHEAGLVGRLLAHAVIDNKIPPLWETQPQDFPLVGEVLSKAKGLIVHSRYVADGARARGYSGPIWTIPMPAWPAVAASPERIEGTPVVGCFGHLNASKRVPQLIAAFERLRGRRPHAALLLVGGATRDVEALRLPPGVTREEYVPEERLWALMAGADVHVALRAPTMGETSASVVRSLSLGKPLVVSDVGWFSELPDDVAFKVPVGDREAETIAAALGLLAADANLRAAMGSAARRLAETEHRLDRVADLYAAALAEAAGIPTPAVEEVVTA